MFPVRIGTCGWSYKEWAGTFYPAGTAAGEFLSCYAERFAVVEVDSTFYRSPSIKMVQGWRDRTPAGFGFSLKVPQVITHEKVLLDCREEVEGFVAAARLLEDKLLCCLLQFGYFNRSAFPDRDSFLERLDGFLAGWPADVPVAVEVRNKTWVSPPLADCLRRHHAVWALADQDWMPSPLGTVKTLDTVTGPFAYVRLLGDRATVERQTKVFDHIVVDRSGQLRDDAQAIRLLSERVPVLVFVNNHFAGHAPATIGELQAMLAEA
ncbi:MAG TPA: DUF72 domain-containing protein [Gemmataceae bacterium]|jgi:uncharacterized protein YecE (DUF72 family)|nr:DUF72 domain-containing protein [Gemmataceae bacterium]